MNAIVYTSNAGTTKEYADLLGQEIDLPVYSLKEAKQNLGVNADIIYLGWVMASKVKGYSKAIKRYNVKALCGICMGESGSQIKEISKSNHISEDTPVFSMRGGFDIKKLHGIYRMLMSLMVKFAGKALLKKADRTPEEDIMLEMMLHGGNYVSKENMTVVLDWYYSCNEEWRESNVEVIFRK